VVGYDTLSHTITKLRKAFGDDPKNPRHIETIPKVGYRLIADVSHASLKSEEIDVAEKSAEGTEQTILGAPERRLPFVGATVLLIMVGIGIALWQPWAQLEQPASIERIASDTPSNDAAREAYQQGLSYYHRYTPADNAKAEAHFKRAIESDPEGIDPEFSNALLLSFGKAMFLAHKNLSKSVGAKSANEYILRSRIALFRHQVEVALREVERALDIRVNDVDALTIKARALVYSGQLAQGRNLANQTTGLDPTVIAEPLYITGLSYFASGNYTRAADYIERALETDGASGFYNLLLAATYGKLGMKKEAKDALLKFRETWIEPFWMAVAVFLFPFEDGEVLNNLADGFDAAGVVARPPSRYLELNRQTRLSGQEIETLLFGHTIKGKEFLIGSGWSQKRTTGGKVSHTGTAIHIGTNPGGQNLNKGESWIDDDRLCNRWFDIDGDITSCALIFRDLLGDQDHYYMVTDFGPSRFQVTN
jgi:tetratricopeptide (TPR) repeat protein